MDDNGVFSLWFSIQTILNHWLRVHSLEAVSFIHFRFLKLLLNLYLEGDELSLNLFVYILWSS